MHSLSPRKPNIHTNLVVCSLAMVANELEAADNLANGEETKQLGGQDTAADELCSRDVSDLVGVRGRAGGRGLQQGTGVLDGAEGAVEVVLEGSDRSVYAKKKKQSS